MVVANGQKATILIFALPFHQVPVFEIKKLMSMIATLYNNFLASFIVLKPEQSHGFS